LVFSLLGPPTSDPPKDGFTVAASQRNEKVNSSLFESTRVLVCLDHVARFIVNANHSVTAFDLSH